MHKGFSKNEYGTDISMHVCDECGTEFTLCPAQKNDDTCGHTDCSSYDESRDVEKLLDDGAKLVKVPIN